MKKKEKIIVENILLCGLSEEDIDDIGKKNFEEINFQEYYPSLIKNYQSDFIPFIDDKEKFFKEVISFSYPNGIFDGCPDPEKVKKDIFSFTYNLKNEIKYLSCLSIPYSVITKDKNKVTARTNIILISSFDFFECFREVLENILDVITNYFNSLPPNEKKMYLVFKGPSHGIKIQEYLVIKFYFSLLINTRYDFSASSSYLISYLENNHKKNVFCKFHKSTQLDFFPLKEYDMSILLDSFKIDHLIQIYLCMLIEKKVFLVYEKHEEINIIISSLISLLYPLKKKNFLSHIFANKSQENYFYSGCVLGIHSSLMNQNDIFNLEDCVIYSLPEKKFIKGYETESFLSFKARETSADLCRLFGEKLAMNSDLNFDNSDMKTLFEGVSCVLLNSNLYFNLKLISIFFYYFINIVKDINLCFESRRGTYENYLEFNSEKFHQGNPFKIKLCYSTTFQNFIERYSKKSNSKFRYQTIRNFIDSVDSKNFHSSYTSQINTIIRTQIVEYYNFKYLSIKKAFGEYMLNHELKIKEGNLKSLSALTVFNQKDITFLFPSNQYLATDLSKFEYYNIYNILIKNTTTPIKDKTKPTFHKIKSMNLVSQRWTTTTTNMRKQNLRNTFGDVNKQNNETIGEMIKSKISKNYLMTGSSSNKNLSYLIQSVSVTPKVGNNSLKEIQKFELPSEISVFKTKEDKEKELDLHPEVLKGDEDEDVDNISNGDY